MEKAKKLSLAERQSICQMRRFGYGIRAIGRELGREHSTISRELKRMSGVVDRNTDYYTQGRAADEASKARRKAGRALRPRLKNLVTQHYVEFHLRECQWSPEIISGKLKTLGYAISYEAIYQYINKCRPELKNTLWVAGRSRRRRRAVKRQRIKPEPAAPKRSIETLPLESKDRVDIGHLELDAMLGKRGGGGAIQTKADRHTRKLFIDKVTSLHAEAYADTLIGRMTRSVPENVLKTILEDNGSEHAAHQRVDAVLGTQSYFCHPYCASERGTVENRHQKLRRFFPKGTDFRLVSDERIQEVEDYFNSTPMKILNFKTPDQVWNQRLEALK